MAPHAATLGTLAAQLESLSPLAVLARGYAVAYDAKGTIVKSVEAFDEGDELKVRVADGTLDCTVLGRQYEDLRTR